MISLKNMMWEGERGVDMVESDSRDEREGYSKTYRVKGKVQGVGSSRSIMSIAIHNTHEATTAYHIYRCIHASPR